jgi:hypothetical protein
MSFAPPPPSTKSRVRSRTVGRRRPKRPAPQALPLPPQQQQPTTSSSTISEILGLSTSLVDLRLRPGLSPYIIQGFLAALHQQPKNKKLSTQQCQERNEFFMDYTNHDGEKKYKVIDYAPYAFQRVRRLSNIPEQQHLQSMRSIHGGAEGEGKSGMLFFQTQDQQYVLKTLKSTELPVMLRFLPEYVAHLERFRCSLLPRFYGLTTFHFPNKGRYILIVMENVLRPKQLHSGWFSRQPQIHEIYDLKGSTKGRVVGRTSSTEKREPPSISMKQSKKQSKKQPKKQASLKSARTNTATTTNISSKTAGTGKDITVVVLKDLDCQRRLVMDKKRRARFFTQLRSDVNLLIRQNLMDYSLLMGISFHGGSDAYRRASSSLDLGSSGGGGGSSNTSSISSNMNGGASSLTSDATTAKTGVPLQAVVNRVYAANIRMNKLLPPLDTSTDGSKYVVQCSLDGRAIVRERGLSPYVVFFVKMTKIITIPGRWVNSQEKETWHVYRRYTDFVSVRNTLNSELSITGYSTVVPALPPKVWIGNFDEKVLDMRQGKLDIWLSNLLSAFSSKVSSSLSIKTFLTRNADEPPLGMSRRRSKTDKPVPLAAKQSMRVARATDVDSGSRVTLFLGVIDILQIFTMKKYVEASIKGRLSHPMAVSATDAQKYGARFVEYLAQVLPPK